MQRARKLVINRPPQENALTEAREQFRTLGDAVPETAFARVRDLKLPRKIQDMARRELEAHADEVDRLKDRFDLLLTLAKAAHAVTRVYSAGPIIDIRTGAVIGNLKDMRDHLLTGVEGFIASQRSKRKAAITATKGLGKVKRLEKARAKVVRALAHEEARNIKALEPTFRMMERHVRDARAYFDRTS